MNTNPQVIRILCYGDSNTWGHGGNSKDRYPVNGRWTGLLQEKLGENYEVIEEGLCGRTTDLDDNSSAFSNKNGLNYLPACLDSQNPSLNNTTASSGVTSLLALLPKISMALTADQNGPWG